MLAYQLVLLLYWSCLSDHIFEISQLQLPCYKYVTLPHSKRLGLPSLTVFLSQHPQYFLSLGVGLAMVAEVIAEV